MLTAGGLVITLSNCCANIVSQCDTGQIATKSALLQLPLALSVKLVAVTLPSAQAAANTSLQLKLLGDVDTTTLNDGSLLQYRASDQKFVARTEIITTTGTLVFNCGSF